jgi:hypothetical protein
MSVATTALDEPSAVDLTHITDEAAFDDKAWFDDHPERRFRARAGDRGVWIIRRRAQGADPDVYLRTFIRTTAPPLSDSDGELAGLWYRAAFPDWPPEKIQKAARKALRSRA